MSKYFLLTCSISYSNNKQNINEQFNYWNNKNIQFPQNVVFVKDIFDTVDVDLNNCYKIFSYNDSVGCLNCNLSLSKWKDFINEIDILTQGKVKFFQVIGVKNMSTLKDIVYGHTFHYPLCIDKDDKINKLNNFSKDYNFRTFLLDENNKVILIGNPVQNPKIKDLYIRTICERLGIDTTNINIADNQENHFSFGRFSFSDTMKTQFVLKNDSLPELKIDSIFTSCECTTAKIDKSVIKKSDSAIVSVSFKTDKPEEFVREVYVKTNSKEKPIVYTIEGKAF